MESSGLMAQSFNGNPDKEGGREPKVLIQKYVWKLCGLHISVVLIGDS